MDEAVLKAIARWPNVPAVAGWLRLDRRGRWWVKNAATEAFETIGNPQIVAFIGRNFAHDDRGRWFFQNGPQRVYVGLEATPLVYRLNDAGDGFVAQTDEPAGPPRRLLLDPTGTLVVDAAPGPGVVLDRDLALVLERLHLPDGSEVPEAALDAVMAGGRSLDVALFGTTVPLVPADLGRLPAEFGFVAEPVPD